MYRLTEKRFSKAKSILDKYRSQLHDKGRISNPDFEEELRDCWNIGYQELKEIILELAKHNQYRFLAAYYMEMGFPGVVSEFKNKLADMYGIKIFDGNPERDSKREEFWKGLNT
jgi:hypothetical protein